MKSKLVIFTGGSGLLGTEFKKLHPNFLYPSSNEFNVTNYIQMEDYVKKHGCDILIHSAAISKPPLVEKDPLKAIEVNIIGTANIVKLCMKFNSFLIYISTDYVFSGDKGYYKESDDVNPINKYGWSKLAGECSVKLHEKSLIVRTTFGPNKFPYEKAFNDQWTSKESVSNIVKKLSFIVSNQISGVIHIGGPRRTLLEYANDLDKLQIIQGFSRKDVSFQIPKDTSLDCTHYDQLKNNL